MAAKQKTGRQLTPLELQIMKVLWDSGPSTVLTVQDRLFSAAKTGLHHRTDHAECAPP